MKKGSSRAKTLLLFFARFLFEPACSLVDTIWCAECLQGEQQHERLRETGGVCEKWEREGKGGG